MSRDNNRQPDYDRLGNCALIERGTHSLRANEIATTILKERGCLSGVSFLRDWHGTFGKNVETHWKSYSAARKKPGKGWLVDHEERRGPDRLALVKVA